MNRLNKDEILYFFRRYRIQLAIAGVLLIALVIIVIYTVAGKQKQSQIGGVIEPPNNSAVAIDGTTYEAEYVQTNFELKQLIVEGDWRTGKQYRVYFDKVKNEYTAWETVKTTTGSVIKQVDYNFTIIGSPKELTEIPTEHTAGIDTLEQIDDDFYIYQDIAQIYSYINANINRGYSLKYLRAQSNMCEAYFVYHSKAYHLLAADNLMMIAPYEGNLAPGMIESESTIIVDDNIDKEPVEQEQEQDNHPGIDNAGAPMEEDTNTENFYAPGLENETPPLYGPSMEEETKELTDSETAETAEQSDAETEEESETKSNKSASSTTTTNKSNTITQMEE